MDGKNFRHFLALIVLVIGIAGCDSGNGSLGCGGSTPSCCYDSLFGCGTFDLPFGCSCSFYGLYFKEGKALPKALASTTNLNGTWSGMMKRTASSCPALLPEVVGTAQVRESHGKVTVRASTYGRLTGTAHGKGYVVSGKYLPSSSQSSSQSLSQSSSMCSAQVRVSFTRRSSYAGIARATINYSCDSKPICSAIYNGALQKKN